jgi:hypothetical protein
MGLLSNLFGRKDKTNARALEGKGTREADAAIRDARAGRISVPQMLQSVLAAQIYVPLSDPPVIEGKTITRWKPATVTKQADGTQFLVAFTDPALMTAFLKNSPEHSFGFVVEASWVMRVLPPGHGIAFNVGGDNGFEWNADGISAYKSAQ